MKLSARQKQALLATAAACTVAAGSAFGAGFQLYEQGSSGTGDYHAGYAAEADDATTEFYNPAGMVRLKQPEVSVGAVVIPLDAKFNGDILMPPLPANPTGWVDGSTTNLIPNFHIVYPFKKRWAFGFGVTVPFGLATSYPWSNVVSSQGATVTRLAAFDFNPNVAFAVNDKLSIAAGFDVVYGTATYDQNILNAEFTNQLSDTAFGWNAGLLYQFSPKTRVGLSYRSHVALNATGTSYLGAGALSTETRRDDLNAKLDLPGYAVASVFSGVTPKWDVMGTAMWTNWNRFGTLQLNNTALSGVSPILGISQNVTVHENYHNSWNFAVGAHYHVSQRVMLKMGAGYDLTPTRTGYRDMRLPDGNRIALAGGVQAGLTKWLKMDLGWIHLFGNKVDVDNTQSGSPVTMTGTARMAADVVGLQFSAKLGSM